MSLTGTIRDEMRLTNTGVSELGTISDSVVDSTNYPNWTVTDGTAASQADLVFRDTRTLALSSDEGLDLAGNLTDSYGNVLTFVNVKMLYISAAATNGGNIIVGGVYGDTWLGAFTNATDQITLPASAWLKWVNPIAGYPVTAGSADVLKIENDDGSATGTYDIVIVGTSA